MLNFNAKCAREYEKISFANEIEIFYRNFISTTSSTKVAYIGERQGVSESEISCCCLDYLPGQLVRSILTATLVSLSLPQFFPFLLSEHLRMRLL